MGKEEFILFPYCVFNFLIFYYIAIW